MYIRLVYREKGSKLIDGETYTDIRTESADDFIVN